MFVYILEDGTLYKTPNVTADDMKMSDDGYLTIVLCSDSPKVYVGNNEWQDIDSAPLDI